MLSASRFLAPGVMVALLLVSSLPSVVAAQQDEGATVPPIELPAETPEGIESGTFETPLGQARWVHLRGDEATLPPAFLFHLVSTPDGYIVPEWASTGTKLWRSPDLISWTAKPLDIGARYGQLTHADGTYWLITSEPAGLWRSQDADSWRRLSLDRLARPGPDGYAWSLRPSAPLVHDEVVIVPFEWGADYGLLTRGLPGADRMRAPDLTEIEPGVFALHEFQDPVVQATLRFEETASGVRVVDDEDGTELILLERVSMQFIERLLSGDIPGVSGLGILNGDALMDAELPGDAGASWHQALTVDDAGFASYSLGSDDLVHVHRSQDGRDWIETDAIGDDAGEPTDIEAVGRMRGSLRMYSTTGPEWTSTDGVAWEAPPSGFHGEPFASGWISGPAMMGGLEDAEAPVGRMWYQPKGGEPVPIDTEMGLPASDCGGWEGLLSSNTMASSFDEECTGLREMWILTFDELPA